VQEETLQSARGGLPRATTAARATGLPRQNAAPPAPHWHGQVMSSLPLVGRPVAVERCSEHAMSDAIRNHSDGLGVDRHRAMRGPDDTEPILGSYGDELGVSAPDSGSAMPRASVMLTRAAREVWMAARPCRGEMDAALGHAARESPRSMHIVTWLEAALQRRSVRGHAEPGLSANAKTIAAQLAALASMPPRWSHPVRYAA
jgi:hypothetical protein